MKITTVDTKTLRNEEHCQFMTDAGAVIAKHQAGALQVQSEYESFVKCHTTELALLELMSKSFSTDTLIELDAKRDNLFRGIALSVESALYHYDPSKVAVAERLTLVLKEYGNVARKTYAAESAALSKITIEAKTVYAKDFIALGLAEWVGQLERANNEFQQVMQLRYEETAGKTEGMMKEARVAADGAYSALCDKLDAYMLITKDAKYDIAIKAMNAVVDKYATMLASRKGKHSTMTEKRQLAD